jgi:serine/threonine-protein kinase
MAEGAIQARYPTGAAPSVASEGESGRAFLQDRLGLLARIWLVWSASLQIFADGLPLLSIGEPRPLAARLTNLVIPVMMLGCWLTCRRGHTALPVLRALDAGLVFVGCVASTLHTLIAQPHAYYTNTVALIAFMGLVSRAVFVPSSPQRTWWISLAVAAASMAVALALRHPEISPLISSVEATAWTGIFSLCAVAIATLASWVIYGLRQEVRKARQLGQYTLEEEIGQGGMGKVYRARHALLRRPTAVKLIRASDASDAARARFEREVQLTSSLSHPNTIAIYDYGHTPDGVFYYAMEYLQPGLSLEALVELDGPQPEGRVVHILRQVCGALAEAHGIGLIHRDIKPANVMLCERGGLCDVAKVLDFGLVKDLAAPTEQALTSNATLTGTPLYMNPEAIESPELVDARSDLYALGAVAYFLLTGRPVFEGRSVVEVLAQHLHDPPVPPSELLGSPIDPQLEELVLRCLAKDREQRPGNAGALLAAIEAGPARHVPAWTRDDARAWWQDRAGICSEREVPGKSGAPDQRGRSLEVDLAGRLRSTS